MLEISAHPIVAGNRVVLPMSAGGTSAAIVDEPLGDLARALDADRMRARDERIRAEVREELRGMAAAALEAAGDRITEAIDRAEESLSTDAIELGVEIARQILKVEIAASNYDLERLVRSTLGASDVKRGHCVVFLNPDDIEMIDGVTFRKETELRSDASVPRGSVHVETPRGLLVRDPNAALEEIREQLLEDLV